MKNIVLSLLTGGLILMSSGVQADTACSADASGNIRCAVEPAWGSFNINCSGGQSMMAMMTFNCAAHNPAISACGYPDDCRSGISNFLVNASATDVCNIPQLKQVTSVQGNLDPTQVHPGLMVSVSVIGGATPTTCTINGK